MLLVTKLNIFGISIITLIISRINNKKYILHYCPPGMKYKSLMYTVGTIILHLFDILYYEIGETVIESVTLKIMSVNPSC